MALINTWSDGQNLFEFLEMIWEEKSEHHHLLDVELKLRVEAQFINTRAFLERARSRDTLRDLNVMLSCLHFLVTQALIALRHLMVQ